MEPNKTIRIENAKITFRNFSGRPEKYNKEGKRNFCVVLDREMGEILERDGWNVKWFKIREEGDEPEAYLQVAVNYDSSRPPKIFLKTSNGSTLLDEISISLLDTAEIENLDMIINPSRWKDDDDIWRIKAYLRSMEVVIYEDEIEIRNRPQFDPNTERYGD